MRLHYVHSANVQVPSANAVQTMHMCEAFSREGAEVELSYPRYLWGNAVPGNACHDYYGVEPCFPLRPLPAPFTATLMRTPAALPAAKLMSYAIEAGRAARGRSRPWPDVFYTRCATAALALPVLRRLRPEARPLVVFEAHEFPRDRWRARSLRYVDCVVAITRAAADDLRQGLSLGGERILVAPDGVPNKWLEAIAQDTARAQLGLRPRAPLVVYTGKVHADTLSLLLDAAEALRSHAELLVVGAPPGESRDVPRKLAALREQAKQRGLAVQFVGPQPVERVRLYQHAASILIAPYSGQLRWARYASPLKIFEYMAACRPMVVSDLPVLREVLQHDKTAWLVAVNSGAALADGVRLLLRRPDLGDRLAAAARAGAPDYTWSRRARAILDFLNRRPWESS